MKSTGTDLLSFVDCVFLSSVGCDAVLFVLSVRYGVYVVCPESNENDFKKNIFIEKFYTLM
jgi:hypothetical protein